MTVRPLAETELEAVCRRLQAEFPALPLSVANVRRKVFGDPDYQPELNLVAWADHRPQGALLGVVRGDRAVVKLLTIGPEPAVADQLLSLFDDRARAAGCHTLNVSDSPPSYFAPGIEADDTRTLTWYLERGFERRSIAVNMAVDLTTVDFDTTSAETRLAADGLVCRRLTEASRPRLEEFILTHFSRHWLEETMLALAEHPVPCHVALDGERVVAFAAAEVGNPGLFGPMGTDPAYRRRGLGEVLLRRALGDLWRLGYRRAEISWAGPVGFYHRHCGARVTRHFWLLSRRLAGEG